MRLQEDLVLFWQSRSRCRWDPTRPLGRGLHLSNTLTLLAKLHSWHMLHQVHILKSTLIPGYQDLLTVFCLFLWLIGNWCVWSLLCIWSFKLEPFWFCSLSDKKAAEVCAHSLWSLKKKNKKKKQFALPSLYQFPSLYSQNIEGLFVLLVCAVSESLLEQASLTFMPIALRYITCYIRYKKEEQTLLIHGRK